jgi:hypothetical protein
LLLLAGLDMLLLLLLLMPVLDISQEAAIQDLTTKICVVQLLEIYRPITAFTSFAFACIVLRQTWEFSETAVQ